MKVRSFIGYPSYDRETPTDWRAYNITMALKGGDFKGYADIRISGKHHRISSKNTAPILSVFGQKVVESIWEDGPGIAAFVLPSSGCTIFGDDEKAERMAAAIRRAKSPIPVIAPFRWVKVLPKAAGQHGTRDPDVLHKNMRFAPQDGIDRAFLVDDVKTTGGHLRAASRVLRDHGIVTLGAICFARTVWERPEKLITDLDEEIGD